METDHRQEQRVIATFKIEDRGQDFIELDVLENGALLGDSVMFKNGRLTLLGLGTSDGMEYHDLKAVRKANGRKSFKGLLVYMKETGTKDPLPWNAQTLRYPVTGRVKVKNPDRFITKK